MIWMIVKYTISCLLPSLLVLFFYFLERKQLSWKNRDEFTKKLLIGIAFSILMILYNEWHQEDYYYVNMADVVPLCAGFFCCPAAGVICGVLGGLECFLAGYLKWGTIVMISSALVMILAGVLAAYLKKYFFEHTQPKFFFLLFIGIIISSIHYIFFYIFSLDYAMWVTNVAKKTALSTLLMNGIAVALPTIFLSIAKHERISLLVGKKRDITTVIQFWLLASIIFAFTVTTGFTGYIQFQTSRNNGYYLLNSALSDVSFCYEESFYSDLYEKALKAEQYLLNKDEDADSDYHRLTRYCQVDEINIINSDGIIINSSNEDFIGFDMASGEQSSEFLKILDGSALYVAQKLEPISADAEVSMCYFGIPYKNGILQVGINEETNKQNLAYWMNFSLRYRRVGEAGLLVCFSQEGEAIQADELEQSDQDKLFESIDSHEKGTFYSISLDILEEEVYYCSYQCIDSYVIFALLPLSEIMNTADTSVFVISFSAFITAGLLFAMIYILVNRVILKNLQTVNHNLEEIVDGNLDVCVNVRSLEEFSFLSDKINSTVETLKQYISDAEKRMARDLEMARSIQLSSLPRVFPDTETITLYACTNPAREVGGDFYDFYFTRQNLLHFLIADVSGKGIPASLFMMRAKTQLKGLTESGLPVNEVFTRGNQYLCEGNEAEMFVTSWQGCLDLDTGKLYYANAGHNPPLIRHADGEFSYLRSKINLVLAGMEGITYQLQELTILPGDQIFLYTDGVTEATNSSSELYGEERLKAVLNARIYDNMENLCQTVQNDIDAFVGPAPQFDDITMMALEYHGSTAQRVVSLYASDSKS